MVCTCNLLERQQPSIMLRLLRWLKHKLSQLSTFVVQLTIYWNLLEFMLLGEDLLGNWHTPTFLWSAVIVFAFGVLGICLESESVLSQL